MLVFTDEGDRRQDWQDDTFFNEETISERRLGGCCIFLHNLSIHCRSHLLICVGFTVEDQEVSYVDRGGMYLEVARSRCMFMYNIIHYLLFGHINLIE